MIRFLKKFVIYLFILLFPINFIQAMEVGSDNFVPNIPQENAKHLAKKTKSQKKREGRKRAKIRAKKEEAKHELETAIQNIREAGTLPNIKQLVQGPEKLGGLNVLANVLMFQNWMVKEIKTIQTYSKLLVDTAFKSPPCCFSISGEKGLCGSDKCNTYQLLDPEAQSLASELIAPLLYSADMWDKDDLLDDLYQKNIKFIDHKNVEIATVGKYIVNRLVCDWINKKLDTLWCDILSTLSLMLFNVDNMQAKAIQVLNDSSLSNTLAKWLIKNKVFLATQKLLPDFINIALDMWDLYEYFSDLWDEHADFSDIKNAQEIHSRVVDIIEEYESLEIVYKELYETIYLELHNHASYSQICLIPTQRIDLPKVLDAPMQKYHLLGCKDEMLKSDDLNNVVEASKFDHENESDLYNFITEVVKSSKKNKPQMARAKKKKSRKNRYKKKLHNQVEENQELAIDSCLNEKAESTTSISDDLSDIVQPLNEEYEYAQLPVYAPRILKWFDSEQVKMMTPEPTADSILYHTYSLLADLCIQKHGIKQIQPNRSNPNIDDIAYYMAGIIKYKNGDEETVVFGICFGEDSVCYHRGYERTNPYNMLMRFKDNLYKYKFPDLSQQLIKYKKNFNLDNESIYSDTHYIENSLYIEIYDSINEITITLIKPD